MDDPSPAPSRDPGSRRRFPVRFRLHPPSLLLGILAGLLGAVLAMEARQRPRPTVVQEDRFPRATVTRPEGLPPQATEATPPPPSPDPSKPSSRNVQVDALLNSADLAFRAGMDGCPAVSLAIRLAREPEGHLSEGAVGSAQSQEIRGYAERCELRF